MNELPEFNRYRDFNFKKEKLYVQGVDTGISVVPDLVHENMFRVKWPDGVLSKDFYNFTMARENARTVANRIDLKAPLTGSTEV